MSLLKARLELKKKLEGKQEDNTPVKKEQKSVSKLVIPQKFASSNLSINSSNSEEKSKSLNASLSKSTGNLSSSNTTRKLSASLFKSNSIQIEDKPQVVFRGPSERKLSSKSFSIYSLTENITFDDVKPNSRPKAFAEDTSRSSNSLSGFLDDSSSQSNDGIPIIVGSIRKDSLPDNSLKTPDELANVIHFVRSPKPSKKEETSTILHFNFAAKPDAFTEQDVGENLRKIPSLHRSGSRCAILLPEEEQIKHTSKEETENVDVATKYTPKEEDPEKIKNVNYGNNHLESHNINFFSADSKKFDVKEEEIYVNIDIFRRYYDSAARIKCGPIKKNPVPCIRYSLIRKFTNRI